MPENRTVTLGDVLAIVTVVVIVGGLLLTVTALRIMSPHDTGISKEGYCRSSLNALAKSALVYAEMNRGFLMSYTDAPVPGTDLPEAPADAWDTAACFAPGPVDPSSGLLVNSRGHGRVVASGILPKPELFYCPAQEYPPARQQYYAKPWGSATRGSRPIYCGYMYNPWVKAAGTGTNRFVYEDRLALEKHRSDRFLGADLMTGPQTIAHRRGKTPVWNVAFPDGHVAPFEAEGVDGLFAENAGKDWESWANWGAASGEGAEAPPGTVRHELLKAMAKPATGP